VTMELAEAGSVNNPRYYKDATSNAAYGLLSAADRATMRTRLTDEWDAVAAVALQKKQAHS